MNEINSLNFDYMLKLPKLDVKENKEAASTIKKYMELDSILTNLTIPLKNIASLRALHIARQNLEASLNYALKSILLCENEN